MHLSTFLRRALPVALFCCLVPAVVLAQKPTVDFTADKIVGCAPLTVSFTDKSSVDVIDWQWDVDGNGVVDYLADPEPVHTYTSPGLYTVKLTVSNFVDSAVLIRTRYIRVTSPAAVNVPVQSVCLGDSISVRPTIIGGIRPFTYFWSAVDFPFVSTDSIPKFGPDTTRQWLLTLTDSVGCTSETPFTIIVRPAPAKPEIVRTGLTLSSSVLAAKYQWYLDGKPIPGAVNRSYLTDTSKLKTGWIFVEVRDVAGCASRSDSLRIEPIATVESEISSDWMVYPHPVSDRCIIRSSDGMVPEHIDIYSVLGEKLRTLLPQSRGNDWEILMSDFGPGIYFIGVQDRYKQRFLRVVKE
jgi:PKD repeat protein